MSYEEVLKTELFRGKPQTFVEKRRKRIQEAISWESGTRDTPLKHLVTRLDNDIEVFFLKPGKEVFNEKRPNPYDMTPFVGSSDERFRFDEIWTYLSKISILDFDIFKAVLTLIYRDGYLIDHIEVSDGKIRYLPNSEISRYVTDMDDGSYRSRSSSAHAETCVF